MNFETARDCQTAWKTEALLAVACELVQAGLRCYDSGTAFFGPDDIPETFTADGVGITGSAVHMLRAAGVIVDYFGHHPEAGVMHGRRRSKRESANGRKVCTYQLVGRGLAEAFLERHGRNVKRQLELAI